MHARVSQHQEQQGEMKQIPDGPFLTDDGKTDRALWQLSQVLAEIAATEADSMPGEMDNRDNDGSQRQGQ